MIGINKIRKKLGNKAPPVAALLTHPLHLLRKRRTRKFQFIVYLSVRSALSSSVSSLYLCGIFVNFQN